MKNRLTISIDQELLVKLKAESNYSDVINEQMKGYYDVKKIENLEILNQKLAEIKQNSKILRKKRRIIEDNIEKITKKQKLFKKKLLSKAKMIEEVIKRRKQEQHSQRRITYYETPNQEVDRLLKGGTQK